jgi:hypothetical protein
VLDPVVSTGAHVVAYTSMDGTTGHVMAFKRGRPGVVAVSTNKTGSSDDPSISDDGTRIAFSSTATDLSPNATDGNRLIYVRDLRTGTTKLVSDPKAAYPKPVLAALAANPPPKPVPAPIPPAPKLVARGDHNVFILDNEFYAGGARPVIRVAPGTEIDWRWRSHESHSLDVRSGPARFVASERNTGNYGHRFTKPGTYTIVCQLHAPGMQMTVVVE